MDPSFRFDAIDLACADPEILVRGVQVSLTKKKFDKKSSDFVFVFFSPQLILQKSNG